MRKKVFQEKSKVISNARMAKDYFKLSLSSTRIPATAKPGQFVQIRISDKTAPLLRRPLGIHRVGPKSFEVLFKVVGEGTSILSQRKPGEYLDIIGPVGNGFDLTVATQASILVAGGMGVAPLTFLAEKLAKRKVNSSKLIVLIGAKTRNEVLCAKEFSDLGCEVKIATDDGSRGLKGKVTQLLERILLTGCIYACGPKPMLREIAAISKQHHIPAQVSLEEHMACGIGACLGCVINTKKGFQRVCKEGPVFGSEEIIW